MSDQTTTERRALEVADRVKAAVAAFNLAVEEAAAIGLIVTLDQVTMQRMTGDTPMLIVKVSVPL